MLHPQEVDAEPYIEASLPATAHPPLAPQINVQTINELIIVTKASARRTSDELAATAKQFDAASVEVSRGCSSTQ